MTLMRLITIKYFNRLTALSIINKYPSQVSMYNLLFLPIFFFSVCIPVTLHLCPCFAFKLLCFAPVSLISSCAFPALYQVSFSPLCQSYLSLLHVLVIARFPLFLIFLNFERFELSELSELSFKHSHPHHFTLNHLTSAV